MSLVFYDKREGPTGPNEGPFITFTQSDDGRHRGYISQAAMDALGRPQKLLMGFDPVSLTMTLHNGNEDPGALAISHPKPGSDAGQFSAGGFLRFFRLEDDMLGRQKIPLRRVNGHLAVQLFDLEDPE